MSTTYHDAIATDGAITVQVANTPMKAIEDAINTASGSVSDLAAAVVTDTELTTTDGGTASNTWNNATLNTEDDAAGIVAVAGNRFTPTAGTYLVLAYAPGVDIGHHKLLLYNVTQGSEVAHGQNATANITANAGTPAFLAYIITANGTDAYQIQHYATTLNIGDGQGVNTGDGGDEVYLTVLLFKIPS